MSAVLVLTSAALARPFKPKESADRAITVFVTSVMLIEAYMRRVLAGPKKS